MTPQLEHGYTRIANEIMEALCKIRINGESRQVLDFVIRKTYGYNKRSDRISLSQFENGTGLKKTKVCKALNKLKFMKLIIQIQNDNGSIYEFNKYYPEWEVVPKKGVPQKGNAPSPQKGNTPVPIKGHTKDNIQKTIIQKTKLSIDNVSSASNYKPDHTPPKRKPKVLTDKQKIAVKRLRALSYFHDKGVENGFEYLLEEDYQANKKFVGLARAFENRYPENWKEAIDWWFAGNNAWCDYHPANFFNTNTYMKFDNRNKKKGGAYKII